MQGDLISFNWQVCVYTHAGSRIAHWVLKGLNRQDAYDLASTQVAKQYPKCDFHVYWGGK